ncbi:MAG TPA: methionyl-tRNA formyltransferase, partial [Candidatus Saccharimonadales bacterium]
RGNVPVLEVADELNIRVLEAADKHSLRELFKGRPVTSKVAILIDFGVIVPQPVIDYFPLGIINSHFSLLPEWRGADPITFSILSGQKSTGVSLMQLVAGLDEGALLAYAEYPLSATITTPELTDDLIDLSYRLLEATMPNYIDGSLVLAPQDITGRSVSYSRKLTKEDGILDWTKPAAQLEREIRAFIDWPKSRTTLNGMDIVVTSAHVIDAIGEPGKTDIVNKQPVVCTSKNALAIDRIKPAGKKEMTGEAFLAGYKKQFLGLA